MVWITAAFTRRSSSFLRGRFSYENVSIESEPIMHLEKERLKSELVKRVVRYIQRKELSPDNSSKEWLDLV